MRFKSLICMVFLCVMYDTIESFEFIFGECPIVFFEPCKTKWIKFTLSINRKNGTYLYNINPYKPVFPADFNILKPFKIIIHGYGGLTVDTATKNVTRAYQDVGFNVIIVDWESLASIPCYATAYLNTWHVGQCVAVLAVSLLPLGISPDLTHLVGFSLGAHIAGFAGEHVNRTSGIPFQRITGLDPALPFFATLKYDWKLDKSDAKFVDIIHTSSGFFGKIEASGHVDFYVNGGTLQPFCVNFPHPPLCSHILAGLYFAESIRNKTYFVGMECENQSNFFMGLCEYRKTTIMGEYVNHRSRGIYYVHTSRDKPFGLPYKTQSFYYLK